MAEDDQQQNTVYQVAQLKDDNGEDLTNVLVIITQGGAETVDLNSSDQQIVVVNQQEKVVPTVVKINDNKPKQTIILRPKSGTIGQQGQQQTIVVKPRQETSSATTVRELTDDETRNAYIESIESHPPEVHVQDVAIQTNATTAHSKSDYTNMSKMLPNKTFQCLICGKQLANSSILKRHIRIHTGVRPYQCSLCNKRFTQSNDLTSHMRAHTGSRPFKCEVCGKGFTQRQNVKKHMTTHTGEKNHECPICNKKFSRKHHMQEHMRIHNESDIRCDICQKGFTAKGHLKRHIQQYHNDELSDDINKIMEHERAETVENEIPVVNFATDENVETATIEIGSMDAESAPQMIVGSGTLELDKNDNSNVEATPEILYRCDLCEKQFKDLSFLERHLRLHLEGKLYNCTTCNKVFNYKGLLKRHMVVHTKEKPYECHICHKCFTQSNDLKIHIRLHTGQKPFKCEYCTSSFNQKQQLKNHRRKHTGEKPFECEKCGKRFSRRDHCRAHLKTHNNDHLRCQICGFTARHGNSLEKHAKKHENLHLLLDDNEKPQDSGLAINNSNLKCKYCGKLFKDITRLEKHETNHEKSKFYTCKICDQVYYRLETFQLHCKLHSRAENLVLIDNEDPDFEKNKLEDFVGTMIKLEADDEGENENEDEANEENKSAGSAEGEAGTSTNSEENGAGNTTEMTEGGISTEKNEGENEIDAGGMQKNCLYCCSHCGKMLPWNADLVKHMETHLPEKPGERPSDVTKTGIVQTTTDGRYMCSICGRNFTNLIALQSHIKNIHNMDISDYELDYKENEGFNMTMEDIKLVEQKIQENLRFTGCYSVLKNSAKSQGKRVRSGDEKSKQIYQCEICAKVVKRKENLQRHRKLHEVIHKCDVCFKVFKQRNHLETHKLMKHDTTGGDPIKQTTYVCEEPGCNKYFNKKFNFQRHALYHKKRKEIEAKLGEVEEEVMEENLMVFECRKCNEAFSSCDDLQKHIDENHSANTENMKKIMHVVKVGNSSKKDDQSETEAALRLVLAAAQGISEEEPEAENTQYEYQQDDADNTEIVEIATENVPIVVNQDDEQYGEVIIMPQEVDGASGHNVYNIVAQGDSSDTVPIYISQSMITTVTPESNLAESGVTMDGVQDSTDSDNNAAIAMVALSGEGNQYIGDEHAYGHSA